MVRKFLTIKRVTHEMDYKNIVSIVFLSKLFLKKTSVEIKLRKQIEIKINLILIQMNRYWNWDQKSFAEMIFIWAKNFFSIEKFLTEYIKCIKISFNTIEKLSFQMIWTKRVKTFFLIYKKHNEWSQPSAHTYYTCYWIHE